MSLCGCMDPYLCTAESSFGLRYLSISIRIKLPFFHSFGLLQRIGMTLAAFVAVLDASSPFPAFAI